MAKTKPIGVRFDEILLNKLKEAGLADSPQKALNLYERAYREELSEQPSGGVFLSGEEVDKVTKEHFVKYEVNQGSAQEKIDQLEAELTSIPDKTKGLGKKLSDSIQKKIDDLKWHLK
jgi:hypothetical protein